MTGHDDLVLGEHEALALLDDLADAFADEIPPAHLDRAVDAFWMARTDALVAEIEEHLESGQRAAVRSSTLEHELRFRHDDLMVALTVDTVDRRVDGQVDGRWTSARWLDANGTSRVLELDDSGRFRVSHRGGPASVEVLLADGRRIRTRWTLI